MFETLFRLPEVGSGSFVAAGDVNSNRKAFDAAKRSSDGNSWSKATDRLIFDVDRVVEDDILDLDEVLRSGNKTHIVKFDGRLKVSPESSALFVPILS